MYSVNDLFVLANDFDNMVITLPLPITNNVFIEIVNEIRMQKRWSLPDSYW